MKYLKYLVSIITAISISSIVSANEIKMGKADWDTGYFQAEIYKAALEKMGYKVSGPTVMKPQVFYVAATAGDVDLWVNGWFGTHDGYIAESKGKVKPVGYVMKGGGAQGYLIDKKSADKFGIPIVTLIDTPGAFPGLEAEERGQGEAIARNIFEMMSLSVPIIVIIIGEGASGGALGIGVGDQIFMLENTWYSVISPESCSSILWHSWEYKEKAAEALNLTADQMLKNKLIDGIIPEPFGGAHNNPEAMSKTLKAELKKQIKELSELKTQKLVNDRIKKFSKMGSYSNA